MNRRDLLKGIGYASVGPLIPDLTQAGGQKKASVFRYCLNTSTISGQKPGLKKMIEIAGSAGYDGLELWVGEVKEYKKQGGSMLALKKLLDDNNLRVEDAIGFAPWMVDDDQQRATGFRQMREEMELMAELGCRRIAAPSGGVPADAQLDLVKVGERYHELLLLGRQTGVMPLLEFWGSSPVFYSFGQALMAAAAAKDPEARILPDVYHLYRGGSGFDCLKMVSGRMIDVIHINDYPASIERTKLTDSDRVYPGDGVAPYKQIIADLSAMGGTKVLSLELFNAAYWKQDALEVAKKGLEKMKNLTL